MTHGDNIKDDIESLTGLDHVTIAGDMFQSMAMICKAAFTLHNEGYSVESIALMESIIKEYKNAPSNTKDIGIIIEHNSASEIIN